ncbi:IucA/IucC family protein [Priestia taiwanensis]|uniref:Siderophore biosynthesis protein n=1 Tax=Priestia taiwanensis TaxID=1347902 RepID=A0A917AWN4_9BACI|nr:IucA/IucC family protein [Priestia taiwanensis]MBM7364878.1 siderophore synthetase component [Priestia taiwanensis]GGE82964.1 siderophore biosynthesis protein [Priestia taiwanensis]
MKQSLRIKKAEQRVRRQLIEAILFEGILPYEEEKKEDKSIYTIYGKDICFQCEGKRMAFDRIRIQEHAVYQQRANGAYEEATLEEIVGAITSIREDRERLLHELQQTIKLCEWNEENLPPFSERRTASYEELESEIVEGHPYHPCFKSRTGFTLEDHANYGPESKQPFTLQWVAAKRDIVRIAMVEEEDAFWQRELGFEILEKMQEELMALGKTMEQYTFLPIHPWQWKNLKEELEAYIQEEDIIPLSIQVDTYRATQSVRTLWNVDYPEKAYVKLPLNMVNTSSLRKLTAHSVCAAPSISKWIKGIVQSDSYLRDTLLILEEYAGIIVEPTHEKSKQLEGQIGAIWRESVRMYMEEGEEAVPFTALMMVEQDERLFIDDWLECYGVEEWLKRFMEVSILPVWHLLVAHGIAVEAHAQNMILLHRNGWPTRIVLRDFHESIEYQEAFLQDKNILPRFEEVHERFKMASLDEEYAMSSVEALRELIMDTLFVFHFSEISFVMDRYGKCREEDFWKEMNQIIAEYTERFPSLLTRHEQLQHTSPYIYVESLLTRKLQYKVEGCRHFVRNELTMG